MNKRQRKKLQRKYNHKTWYGYRKYFVKYVIEKLENDYGDNTIVGVIPTKRGTLKRPLFAIVKNPPYMESNLSDCINRDLRTDNPWMRTVSE